MLFVWFLEQSLRFLEHGIRLIFHKNLDSCYSNKWKCFGLLDNVRMLRLLLTLRTIPIELYVKKMDFLSIQAKLK